jgi:acyl-CoA synthetase (AMP-forming)/AMP-acid ligase II
MGRLLESEAPRSAYVNIASRLRRRAELTPDKRAIVFPVGRGHGEKTEFEAWSYKRLDRTSDAFARGLHRVGIGRGTKTIVMLRPSPELYGVIFALFKLGAVPVIVDPGMGAQRMLHCYERVRAEAFVGLPLAHAVRVVCRKTFAAARVKVTVGSPKIGGGHTLSRLAEHSDQPLAIAPVLRDDPLVINFTTGSTGPARGVEYTHAGVAAMCDALPPLYGEAADAVTFVTLPMLALFDCMLGATAVLAPMDPTKPAQIDAARLAAAIAELGCTHMFASPALLNRLGKDLASAGRRLPSLRRVLSGGAPVSARILRQFRNVLPDDARLSATYGATEALPMASVESREVLGELAGRTAAGGGTCAGYPTDGLEVCIVAITDDVIPEPAASQVLPPGDVGEIAVRGAIVSPRYHDDPANDALAKMQDAGGTWHRTGDLGYLDQAGRLWFGGRKSQRVITENGPRYTVQCEGIFGAHPDVYRAALVGVGPRGRKKPVLCVELAAPAYGERLDVIARELRELAKGNPLTRDIEDFLFHPGFPVDIRHNAKIEREQLAAWASKRVAHERDEGATGEVSTDSRKWARVVPVAGWLFLLYGAMFPLEHPVLRALWMLDLALSVGVHGLQLFAAVPAGRRAGYPLTTIVLCTMLFGATWWRLVEPRELRGRALIPGGGGV